VKVVAVMAVAAVAAVFATAAYALAKAASPRRYVEFARGSTIEVPSPVGWDATCDDVALACSYRRERYELVGCGPHACSYELRQVVR